MDLTWYGLSCFRITERKYATVVTDPFGSKVGLPSLKLKADIVTVSHKSEGHGKTAVVSGQSHTLVGAGEYEIGGVFVTATSNIAQDGTANITYLFDYDGLTVAHLGDMAVVPSRAQIESLGQVDILLIPVGGGNSLNAAQASELVSMIEPSIVIPMHYHTEGLKIELEPIDRFLKEMGVTEPRIETQLKITSSKLTEETEIVLLQPKDQ